MNSKYSQWRIVALGLATGAITGILGAGFNFVVTYLVQLVMVSHPVAFQTRMLVIPVAGGLLLGMMHKYVIRGDLYGFGVAGVMEEIRTINQYLMKPVLVLEKAAATILTLVVGWSAGRQGPIVYIGGAVGSWLGYTYKFNREQIKILIASGVAGALAGVFSEPLFSILFVLEVILHKDYLTYFTPVTAAVVASTAITRLVGMNAPFIDVSGAFRFGTDMELVWMVFLGIFMGLVSVVYIRTIKAFKKGFARIESPVLKGLVGGMIIAALGYFLPDLYDIHLGSIARMLSGDMGWKLLLLLAVFKLIATGVTLGAGGVGGVFLPGLYIGTAFGSLFGVGLSTLTGGGIASAGTYGLVGMAAMFAGFGNAPLSATLLAVELTGESGLVLPFLITTVLSSIITESIQKDSIFGHSNFIWAGKDVQEAS